MAKKNKADSRSEEEEKSYKEEIKEMERKKREVAHKASAVKPMPPAMEEISFDQWYMMRSPSIPKIHRKEVLRADFKGQGIDGKADIARYDEALNKYGVKLKQ